MQPYPRTPDLVWPGHLHGTGCLSARAVGTGFSTVGLRLWLGPGCVWWWVLFTPARCGWGLGWVCLGSVCGVVPLLPAVCGVRGWALVSACFRDLCGFVRVSLAPRRFRFRCAVWACVLGPGLGCAPPFLAGLSGCVFCAFFFFFFPVPRCPCPGPCGLSPRLLSFGLGCWLVSVLLFPLGRCSWLGVAGFGWVVPLYLFGGPLFGALWVGGLAPFCVVGGGLVAVGCFRAPRPPFFLGGGGGRLAVPPFAFSSAGACSVAGVWCGWSLATPGGGSCVLLPANPGWVSLPVVVGGPRHSWLGSAGGGGVWRWCVGGVVAGVWCGWSLATPGGGSCVLLPATPGWVSLPLVVGGPRHSWLGSACGGGVWCVVCGGGVLVGLWLVCGVVCPSPLLAEVPVCYSPPLLAGFRCRWWWAVPATPGWGLPAAVVCGGGVLVGLWLVCGVVGPSPLLAEVPVCYSPPLLAGFRCRWCWAVPATPGWGLLAAVVCGVWYVAVVCWWSCGWCVVWLVPRHSWRRFLCATPRHSWLGFAAGGGGRSPPLLAGVRLRRWCVVCGVWCVVCGGGVLVGLFWCLVWLVPRHSWRRFLCATPRHSWLGFAAAGGGRSPPLLAGVRLRRWCVVCGVWRWCVGGVVAGVWCGWSLATPGGGSCVLLPATPGWVSLPVVVGGPRHSWLGSAGGVGVWCVAVVCCWGCGWCVVWLVPRHSWRRSLCATPRHSWLGFAAGGGGRSPPLLAGVRWRRWCVVCGLVCGVLLGFLATPGGGSCVLLPATPGWVSLPLVVGGPRHSWLGSAGGGGVRALLGRVGRAGLPGAFWCASPFPLAALSFCFAWPPPGWGCPSLFRCCCRSSLVVFLSLPLPGSRLVCVSRLAVGCSLVVAPPPPFVSGGFRRSCLWPLCFFCFFFSLFFFLRAPPLSPAFSGFRPRVPWASALALFVLLAFRFSALRALVTLLCFPPGCWLLPRGCCPPPPFVSRGPRSCRSVLCAVLCCASLGAVLRRAAACCVARCCAVVCCVALVWCRCLLRRALWRCPSPWGPVLCGAVFCGVPPRCVLCAVCVLSWRGGACCCSRLCLVLCVSRGAVLCVPCALRSVRCCASLCWCARVVLFVWCVLLLAPGAVVRCFVLCCFLWCAVVRCWVWWPVVVCWWRVSVSVSLSGRVVCFPVVGVVCCGALLSCVVFCGAVLWRGAVLLCSAVVLRCCWGLLCPPVGRRAVLCCAVGWLCCFWPCGGVCVLWCSFPRAVRSLSSPLCALRCLVVLAVVPCFPVSCVVVLCCRVMLCCRALLSFCGAVCVCFALLRPVVRRQCGLRCCWCLVLWRVPVRCGVSLGVLRCGGAALVCRGVLLCCALSCGVVRSVPCPAVPCCPAVLCWLAVLCGCLRCWCLFCPLFFC